MAKKEMPDEEAKAIEQMLNNNPHSSRVVCSEVEPPWDEAGAEKRLAQHEHHRRGTIALNKLKAKNGGSENV